MWVTNEEGVSLQLRVPNQALRPSEGTGPSLSASFSAPIAARLRTRTLTNIIFRYHYAGSGFRYFYVLPHPAELGNGPEQPKEQP